MRSTTVAAAFSGIVHLPLTATPSAAIPPTSDAYLLAHDGKFTGFALLVPNHRLNDFLHWLSGRGDLIDGGAEMDRRVRRFLSEAAAPQAR
jgi:hypothetical protein